MIYTCTLNPSIDYFLDVNEFRTGQINRVKTDKKMPGGKGINVSIVLKRLGVSSETLGFIGGFTGDFIKQALKKEEIRTNFIEVNGDSRINVKVKSDTETEINGHAPDITKENIDQLFSQLKELTDQDILVLSGSVPESLPKTIYKDMMEVVSKNNVKVIVDTSGPAFNEVVTMKPFLIKPNHLELGDYFGVELSNVEDIISYARKLIDLGVEHVIVSMGGKGALLVGKEEAFFASAPKGQVKNSVGAGDSVVGGFLAEYSVSGDIVKAFHNGAASGSATAFSVDLCTKEEVLALLPEVKLTKI
ncbi:1-phosphofructokinase [Terrilactibacillus sp. BCM23-1]|uniref:Tagatose-6-phosphate kinase n=1 Tax=Terrilactibacillus tamarindi TaxID=2599694 RepID=A0A6N8CP47_9BACI|nr:1-phosphofructokinase [Terrilactibacillus tamarindi]MTT30883.1 1-phosphofructokinase [Terrilactibacillus tamarindi]